MSIISVNAFVKIAKIFSIYVIIFSRNVAWKPRESEANEKVLSSTSDASREFLFIYLRFCSISSHW